MPSLNQLLIDEDFIALSSSLKNQNIFEMLNVGERETIHSRFLGYLLDPNSTHGLGTSFLEYFLLCLSEFVEESLIPDIPVSSLDLDMANVTCEWIAPKEKKSDPSQRIDVIVEVPYKTDGKLILAIECKVNAAQSDSQLKNYDFILGKIFQEQEKNRSLHKIFLTRYEEDPGSKEWAAVLWQDLVSKALNVTFSKNGNGLSPKLHHLLSDYQTVINSWSEESESHGKEDLCQNLKTKGYTQLFIDSKNVAFLYLKAKHREAHECIYEYFTRDNRKDYIGPFSSLMKERGFHESDSSNKHLRFWPSKLDNHPLGSEYSPFPRKWTKDGLPILFEIELDNSKGQDQLRSKLFLQFGPMLEQYHEARYELIMDLRNSFKDHEKWKFRRKSVGSTWARVIDLEGFADINLANAAEIFNRYCAEAEAIVDVVCKAVAKIDVFNKESKSAFQQNP